MESVYLNIPTLHIPSRRTETPWSTVTLISLHLLFRGTSEPRRELVDDIDARHKGNMKYHITEAITAVKKPT